MPGGRYKNCSSCGTLNTVGAKSCQVCGEVFGSNFSLTLDQAMRNGAIVRGMEIDEGEVRNAELIAPSVRNQILTSGDENLVRVLRVLPDESWARLKAIVAQ